MYKYPVYPVKIFWMSPDKVPSLIKKKMRFLRVYVPDLPLYVRPFCVMSSYTPTHSQPQFLIRGVVMCMFFQYVTWISPAAKLSFYNLFTATPYVNQQLYNMEKQDSLPRTKTILCITSIQLIVTHIRKNLNFLLGEINSITIF